MIEIVGEVGINANGDINIALRLMDEIKKAGGDYVKFQKRDPRIVYAKQWNDPRESPWGTTLGEQKLGLEFNQKDYDQIDRHSKDIGLPWFASAWDIPSLEFLRQYQCPYNKIASAMVTNLEFVHAVSCETPPVIMSTGLSTMEEIKSAVDVLVDNAHDDLTLLHCVGVYPCDESLLNLRMIETLRVAYPEFRIGYSGHEASVSPSVVAASLGARLIERHVTLSRAMYGSDQAASLEPNGFRTLVEQVRKIPLIMGDGIKRVTDGEKAVAKKLRYWQAP